MPHFEFNLQQIYTTIVISIAGGFGLLVRKILTSEKQIELLKQELKNLQQSREDHDESVDKQLAEIRHDIKNLLSRGK